MSRDRLAQAEVHHVDHRTDGAISGTPGAPPPFVPAPFVAPPGWYDDGQGATRWFDGHRWTERMH